MPPGAGLGAGFGAGFATGFGAGFVAGFVFAVAATLLTRKPGAEVDAIFDKATEKDAAPAAE